MTIFEINLFWITIAPSYYWLMYVIGFILWFYILKNRKILSTKELDSLLLYVFLWVIIWWRLWYVIFYDLNYYLSNIYNIFKIWEWWMSFHWWLLWVIIWVFLFSYINKVNFIKTINEVALVAPIWIFFGRIWNYINKELLWFEYSWFLAVEKNWKYYFPSPLLEAFLEWIVLFLILLYISKNKKYSHLVWIFFIIWYWFFRLIVELFFRLPDEHLWYIFSIFSMWSLLSIIMILVWIILLILSKNIKKMT